MIHFRVILFSLLSLPACLSAKAEPSGLLAQWNFDEGTGKVAKNHGGNGQPITVKGATWMKLGDGYALNFTAGPRAVASSGTPSFNLTGPVTAALWIRPTQNAKTLTSIFGAGLSNFLLAQYDNNAIYWYIGSGSNSIVTRVKVGQWNHVVGTFDGTRSNLWVNGDLAASRESQHTSYAKADQVSICPPGANNFVGQVDEVRLYNRALTRKEIRSILREGASEHGLHLAGDRVAAKTQQAIDFFHNHAGAITHKETEDALYFANNKIGLAFDKLSGGFALRQIYGIEQKQDYLGGKDTLSIADLFEVSMTLDPIHLKQDERHLEKPTGFGIVGEMAGDAFPVGSQKANTTSWNVEETPDGTVLNLTLKGMDAREDKGVLDVTASFRLQEGDPLSYWRINVTNRSKRYGLERVNFPILNFAPIGNPQENYFVMPRGRGGLVKNPFAARTGFGAHYASRGAFYPHDINMQFMSLYNGKSGKGIYFGTFDPQPHLTNSKYQNSEAGLIWTLAHFPDNIAFSNEPFSLEYDCVVGPQQGDWYDAAMRYRKWAKQQFWLSKGPLSTRKDSPKWFAEAPLIFYSLSSDSAEGTHDIDENLRIAIAHFHEWLDWAGLPMAMNFYGWHDYDDEFTVASLPWNSRRVNNNPDSRWYHLISTHGAGGNYPKVPALPELSSLLRELRNSGGMFCPYIPLEIFDQGPTNNSPYAQEAHPHITRDLHGALRMWGTLYYWMPCAHTQWWQNRLAETLELMVKNEHVGGFYLDVMQGSSMPCYWIGHGHSAGGGSSATDGMHKLNEVIYNRMKAIDPEAITTGENMSENMIDVTDGNLAFTLWPDNKAPIFAAVYQDYVTSYGLEVSTGAGYKGRYEKEYRKDAFFIEATSLFIEGSQVGRIRLRPRDMNVSLKNPEHREIVDFLAQVVGYYKQPHAKKFLAYGRVLRPLNFTTPASMPQLTYTAGYVTTPCQFPALTSGTFLAEDGDVGIFVANASGNNLDYSAQFDLTPYEDIPARTWKVTQVAADGVTEVASPSTNSPISVGGMIPARGITMYLLQPTN